ncbi:MAG: BamA/TamA family outer membrane protein [Ignavibacteriales bacterium]|nr:BamA/TamA family outer membrane protein [Ignavibacteriales bacterium]
MKNNLTLLLLSLLILCTATASGQPSKKEKTKRANHEALLENIGNAIDKAIAKISRPFSSSEDDDGMFSPDSLYKKRSRRIYSTDSEPQEKSITYEGNTTIAANDTIHANVVVKAGDLTLHGYVDGDVLVVGGNLYVKAGAVIAGNAKVINGEVIKEDGGTIVGYVDKASSSSASYRESEKKFTRSSTRLRPNWWLSDETNLDNFIFRYNRVEGIFLGLGSEKRYYWDGRKDYSLYGSIGWGFKSHLWRGNLGLSRQFAFNDGQILEFGVEGHSLTDTKDQWVIGLTENTLSSFLIHEDYRDYFTREGVGFNVAYSVQQDYFTSQLKVEYLMDKYSSLENHAEWSIFGGDKVFRLNPAIEDGKMRSIFTSVGVSTVTKTIRGPEGWNVYATAEFADKSFGSDFGFNQYVADVRRFQPLGRYDNLNVRFRVGTADGRLPVQKMFEIGGLGSLPGFPFKYEAGNRTMLLNAEYIIDSDFLDELDFWPGWLLSGTNFIIFSDAGVARTVSNTASLTDFDGLKLSDFRHDVGVGIGSRSGSFRLAVVWRTDQSESPRFTFRIARPF